MLKQFTIIMKKRKNKRRQISKASLKKLDRIHRKYNEIFKDDEILLAKLRREINVKQRKAS